MTAAGIRPRPDQIAELTRGIDLPMPEVSSVHLEVVAEALGRAFQDIRTELPLTVATGSEAEITALMEARLNTMLEKEPLWAQLVLCVARGKESLSFDGSHLEKRPDLSIYLSGRNRGFPLVAEAKIIDAQAAKTELLYCENGVRRFVKGDYAWGTREAFMIAYVRDGSSINTKLTPFLANALSQNSANYLIQGLPIAIGSVSGDLALSLHGRSFAYSNLAQPGSISVWHLWLAIEADGSVQ